jgi:hypothetical protein
MTDLESIFAADREHPPAERTLPWDEQREEITVVVEPKPHWASDMRAYRLTVREYCYFADWRERGPRARFFRHVDTCGDDVLVKARAAISREIADGLWS